MNITKTTMKQDPPSILYLKNLLQQNTFKFTSDNGKLLPPSNVAYQNICDAMTDEYKKKPKTIYTILLENRYNVFSEALRSQPEDLKTLDISNSSSNTSLTDYEFTVDLTSCWSETKSEEVSQSRAGIKRELMKLKKHSWTNSLFEAIFEQTKIPCALKFKNNDISNKGLYINVTGACPDCCAQFVGYVARIPCKNEPVIMECSLRGFNSTVKHFSKRQLKGFKKKRGLRK